MLKEILVFASVAGIIFGSDAYSDALPSKAEIRKAEQKMKALEKKFKERKAVKKK
jgi:hypothetical protein